MKKEHLWERGEMFRNLEGALQTGATGVQKRDTRKISRGGKKILGRDNLPYGAVEDCRTGRAVSPSTSPPDIWMAECSL